MSIVPANSYIIDKHALDQGSQYYCADCDPEGSIVMHPHPTKAILVCPSGHFVTIQTIQAGEPR